MTEFEQILKSTKFVGIVEDNEDPDKKQRVKIRIPYLHGKTDDVSQESLPWAHPKRGLNGLSFEVPEKGKILSVSFPDGNAYYPEYEAAEHLNINLQKKVEEFSGEDYTSFIALLYNHNSQIYVDNQKGLYIRHKFQEINMAEDFMALNLKDNQSTLYLGDEKGNQEAMLGTNFMEWFDTLMQTLMDAYIGNNGAPCIANPNLINVFSNYQSKRMKFLSKHVFITDNQKVRRETIEFEEQVGDEIEQTVRTSQVTTTTKPVPQPQPMTAERGVAAQNEYTPPIDAVNDRANNEGVVTSEADDEIKKMLAYLKSKGFKTYEAKNQLNIVGLRNKLKDEGNITNRFDDWIWTFYKNNDGTWVLLKYAVTTTPGFKPKTNVLPDSPSALMAYGQYENQYRIGFHQNRTGKPGGKLDKNGNIAPEHRCLKFASTAYIRNDSNGTKYDTQKTKPVQKGSIGLNIHNSGNNSSGNVYNFSEGCQVFYHKKEHDEFMSLCDMQVEKTSKGSFTYTLIPQRDYDNFKI